MKRRNIDHCFGTLSCPIPVCENCDASRECAEKYEQLRGEKEEDEQEEDE